MTALIAFASPAAAEQGGLRFSLGVERSGYTAVPVGTRYDDARGHGWEDPSRFSVKLPEGNYRVTLGFEGGSRGGTATVKAEARRLMIEALPVPRRKTITREIVVNVRTPALPPPPDTAPGGTEVRLSQRDLLEPTWDNRLTLEFLGSDARVSSIVVERIEVPTVYLVGDSTVTDQHAEPAASWGQMLTRFLGPGVAVANHAKSGATMKSFIADLRLAKTLSVMKSGDWLLIQFGHNDQKKQWPQTYAEAGTTYRAYLKALIAEARMRGATPILLTSTERRNFDGAGRIVSSHGAYPEAVRAVASEEKVGLVDLHAQTIAFYEALGPERAPLAFNDGGRDKTHHNNYGAYEIARMVAAGLGKADLAIEAHVLPEGRSYDASRPAAPERFGLPASSARSDVRPEGY